MASNADYDSLVEEFLKVELALTNSGSGNPYSGKKGMGNNKFVPVSYKSGGQTITTG